MTKILIGIVLGVAGCLAVQWYGVDNLKQSAADAQQEVVQRAEESRAESCRKRYLAATGCYQTGKPIVCEARVSKACNPADPAYDGIVPEVK